ncbi:pimeloyl-ACP methyl ester carboxylesterase [Sphingobium sp. B2D3A]|uniref:alpha/beta hydrolase n=1 Tax=unclassified Sphingobium TaxID=2611147 RepID=UPI002224D741|nr:MULTISPECIES: alpha/beta hydrolase [unclassified Sphingobium]MCW2337902.1 pimeloyl-ACP methyl ester carboxylesterase [Sphingobium sp. B2D3A]MCW2384361.1 pimeloyl-ACP methyl ester carboxylesterase [Sphingobium sp. B2D3D]
MADKRGTIVIVHGAWVGGWRWRKVADLLRERGHYVFTPTLTGLGERAHLTSRDVNLALHAQDIANVIRYEELENVLLVGHSYGGMPISQATELIPEGVIQSILYMDAFMPENGQSLNDLVPGEPHLPPEEGDYLVPPPRLLLQGFNAHMDPASRASYEDRRTAQSVYCFSQKAELTGARDRIPQKTYVIATGYKNDTFAPVAERLRTQPDWRVEEMPFTHDLQHVAVTESADMIESALP